MKRVPSVTGLRSDRLRQWLLLLLPGLLGLAATFWLFAPETQMLQALDEEVTQLQARLQQAPEPAPAPAPAPARAYTAQDAQPMPDMPGLNEAASLWPWLQQRLQAQGLQVLALKPQAIANPGGLPEQAVQLRLQGRWRDWQAFEQSMHRLVPWWVIDQWQMTGAVTGPAQVRIELQARLGLLPAALQRHRTLPQGWPVWDIDTDLVKAVAPLFDAPTAVPVAQAAQGIARGTLPEDPRRWPVRALHLLGVWQQDGVIHAVLGQGQSTVVVKPGQRVGQEGYRVRTVTQTGVQLQAAGDDRALLFLTFQGEKP
ncbi:MAG: hypothetical protein ACKOWC_08045 [Limnohabitans sp.]